MFQLFNISSYIYQLLKRVFAFLHPVQTSKGSWIFTMFKVEVVDMKGKMMTQSSETSLALLTPGPQVLGPIRV